MVSDAGTKKTTIELPKGLLDEMAMQAIVENLPIKKIMARALSTGMIATFRWGINDKSFGDTLADTKAKVLFSFKISDDPEDRLELEWTVDSVIALFVSAAEALNSAGVNPQDVLNKMRNSR
jgi:hypothetical protein